MSSGGMYLALAYTVVLVVVLAYVGIITLKLDRMRRDLSALRAEADTEAASQTAEAA
jgi:hypothetical protein